MSEAADSHWSLEEFLALLGTSKKLVVTSPEALARCVELLNGASPEPDDPAHSYDEIALRLAVGLAASGQLGEDATNIGITAWTVALPGFLRGKSMFLAQPETWLSTTIV